MMTDRLIFSWGNNVNYGVKLKKDMFSIDGEIHALDIKDKTAFAGTSTDPLREYRTPKKLSKLTPEVIHEQET